MRINHRFLHKPLSIVREFSTEMKANSLWTRYNQSLIKSPILTKSITAGVLAFIADITCQAYFPNKEDENKPIKERINFLRALKFTFLNSFIVPPIMHYWYNALSTKIIGDSLIAAIKRVACDQLLFAPLILPVFFIGTLLMDNQADKIPNKLKTDWFPSLMANYIVWVPAQLINFKFIPPQLRVLWANFIGFFWSIYLSRAANRKIEEIKIDKKEN